jgi:hypothetical protein
VTPQRFTRALRSWAASGTAPAHAEELSALYAAYHRRLEAIGAPDAEGFARAALDALASGRPRGAAAGAALRLRRPDADPARRRRDARRARRRRGLRGAALRGGRPRSPAAPRPSSFSSRWPRSTSSCPDRSEHYAAGARAALHHLERRLFEAGGDRCPPNGAVRLLEAGGERAEAELVAAQVLELMREGVAPEDVAVLANGSRAAAVLARGLTEYGVPVAPGARVAFSRTRLGAGILAFARAALPGGTATDLLTWLRTPGKLADPDAVDALEARVRRAEAATAAEARRLWAAEVGEGEDPFRALDALAEAAAAGVRRCSTPCSPRRRRSGPPRTSAAPPCSARGGSDARAAAALAPRGRAALARRGRPRLLAGARG